jgi:apolipoprotein N-acyltransferase
VVPGATSDFWRFRAIQWSNSRDSSRDFDTLATFCDPSGIGHAKVKAINAGTKVGRRILVIESPSSGPPVDPPQARNRTRTSEPSKLNSLGLLALGFGLTFIHLFWYNSPWTAWLAICCYAPFMVWLQEYSKRPFFAGWVFGLYYGTMNETWLGQFASKYTQSPLIGIFVVFVIAGVWGCFYGFACWLRTKFGFLRHMSIFAVLMCLMEFGRMNVPQFEYPNSPFGEPLVVYPVVATALMSAYMCMFFVMLCNAMIATAITKPRVSIKPQKSSYFKPSVPLAIGLVVVIAVIFGSTKRPNENKSLGIRIALGQLGADLAYSEEGLKPLLIQEAGDDLMQQAVTQKADLLIFSEGIAKFDTIPTTPFKLIPNMPLIFGAQHGKSPTFQSAFFWNGTTFNHTNKKQLVVFGERVPFRNVIPYPAGFQLPGGDYEEGKERYLFEVKPGIKAGVMICFESMFWGSAYEYNQMNADFLAIISLDDWYMGTNGIPRLAIAAQWRAVEAKKWIVRVGSLGKTMVIDPQGRVRAEIPTGTRQLLVYDL